MDKKEICAGRTVAYYGGLDGVEIKHVEYGINDYIYAVSGCYGGESALVYHRLKVYYTANDAFIRLNGHRIPMSECIKVERI